MSNGKSILLTDTPEQMKKTLAVAESVKTLKRVYHHHRHGWSNDREKSLLHTDSVPLHIRFHPEWRKYFDDTGNDAENRRNFRRFVQRHPKGYMFVYD